MNKNELVLEREIEHRTTEKVKKTIEWPCFCKDKYGYIYGCIDGENTIRIGLKGIINSPLDSHCIETFKYVTSTFIESTSREVSIGEFREAVMEVQKYTKRILDAIS